MIMMMMMMMMILQGDRGFDGLPGLPGDKGHRVRYTILLLCIQGKYRDIMKYIKIDRL